VLVRYREAEYREVGLSDQPTSRLGSADLAACDDVGAAGSSFDDATRGEVRSFSGFSPDEVIGLHQSDYTRVLVAKSVSSARKREVLHALGES
jgi:hypothetical protein